MRRYNSFLVRRWQLPPAERIVVDHTQSGQQRTFGSLAEATRWIESASVLAGPEEMPMEHNGLDGCDSLTKPAPIERSVE